MVQEGVLVDDQEEVPEGYSKAFAREVLEACFEEVLVDDQEEVPEGYSKSFPKEVLEPCLGEVLEKFLVDAQ